MKLALKSNVWLVSKEALAKVFEALGQEYDIFGPTIKQGQGIYSDTDICLYDQLSSFGQLALKSRTLFSAKEILFPRTEKLFEFGADGVREPKKALRKKIVFARSCDIEGLSRLDKIFLENGPPDFYYKGQRDNLYLFLMECLDGFEGCFCQSVEAGEAKGYVLSIREKGDSFLVAVKDESFSQWFEPIGTYWSYGRIRGVRGHNLMPLKGVTGSEATTRGGDPDGSELRSEATNLLDIYAEGVDEAEAVLTRKAQQEPVSIPDFSRRDLLREPVWEEYAKRCLGCGRCNLVCPTCSCFSLYDAVDDKGKYFRQRIWSGCQIDSFAQLAGGHEYRTDKGQRMRYKLWHKFHNFKERFGNYMCVGCGRCIEACPEYIDIRGSLRKLSYDRKSLPV